MTFELPRNARLGRGVLYQLLAFAVLATTCWRASAAPPSQEQQNEFFERRVRPLLAEHCFECHGAQAEEAEGGLRMVSRNSLLVGGDTGPSIVPGKPEESLLIEGVEYSERLEMPPDTKLGKEQVDILKKWIEMGAPWPGGEGAPAASTKQQFDLRERRAKHWCWQPISQPALPTVSRTDWPREAIDYFVLAQLEAHGLSPAPPADRRTLVRRLSFDLTGLPPTQSEIDAFLSDQRPDAVDRLIDRLLASPRFGETWGRHWLDLVRYAETLGHEFDYPLREAWRFRDYVIRVFNDDVPYDQFVREQIAGDLLPTPRRNPIDDTNESILGTYSWLLGEMVHAPVDVRLDQANRIDNQIDVFGKTFLGLTIACARCHDHKFDAISTRDYYGLYGVLESSRRGEHFIDPHRRWERAAREVAAIQQQVTEELRSKAGAYGSPDITASIAQQLEAAVTSPEWKAALDDPALTDPGHPMYVWRRLREQLANPAGPQTPSAAIDKVRSELAALHSQAAGTRRNYDVLFDLDDASTGYTTGWAFSTQTPQSGLANLGGLTQDRILPGALVQSAAAHRRFVGVWRSPNFTLKHPNLFYRLAGQKAEVRLIIDGYTMIEFHQLLFRDTKFPIKSGERWTWYRQAGDLKKYLGHKAHIEVLDLGDGWAAIDTILGSQQQNLPPAQPSVIARACFSSARENTVASLANAYAAAWAQAIEAWQKGTLTREQTELLNWGFQYGLADPAGIDDVLTRARKRVDQCVADIPLPTKVAALVEGSPVDERVFIRGSHHSLGDVAPRGLIEALRTDNAPYTGSGRLRIANEVASGENPLTARVMVNRIWHHLMGRGLVPTVDNFGVLGQPPSHPELLDYLATKFIQDGWSVKQTIRSIVRSRTYQMSSRTTTETEARDPANQYWHRMPVRRLSAEAVRDALLACSGRLDLRMQGPSVPIHLTAEMQGRGRPGRSGPLDGAGRRTIYIEVRRNFLSPMWLAFDGPIPFTTIGRRNVSNVPAQALIMMNDPLVRQQAELMAKRVVGEFGDQGTTNKLNHIYQKLYARPAEAAEQAAVQQFLELQRSEYSKAGKRVTETALWADVIHALLNTKEFLFLR